MRFAYPVIIASIVLVSGLCTAAPAQNIGAPIPKELAAIVGTYSGSWTSYAMDAKGQVVQQASWTDTVKAGNPVVEKARLFVTTTTDMTFDGGRIPPMSVPGKEGYMLNSDGSLGTYFIETYGQVYKMQKLADNVLAYTIPVAQQEFARLGVPNAVSGEHVLIKVVTFEQGLETHNITRVTTIAWKDASGKEGSVQFVSLKGRHQHKNSDN